MEILYTKFEHCWDFGYLIPIQGYFFVQKSDLRHGNFTHLKTSQIAVHVLNLTYKNAKIREGIGVSNYRLSTYI